MIILKVAEVDDTSSTGDVNDFGTFRLLVYFPYSPPSVHRKLTGEIYENLAWWFWF